MNEAFTKLLAGIDAATFEQLCGSGSPDFRHLMDAAATVFEQFPYFDQSLAFALLFGMMCANLEGEPVEAEKGLNCIVGFEERLQMFIATARVAFREAYEARKPFDTHTAAGTRVQ
jgi:hypothetical protein